MIKNNKGVTLIALAIAVVIILAITGMIIYSAKDSIYIKNLTNMQNDIANLRNKIDLYYSEYGDIPAKTEYPDITNLQSAGVIGANDTGKFLIIELEILDGLTLNYGEDYEKYKANDYTHLTELTDIYIINVDSHNIFYVEGVRVKENDETKMYYTDYTEGDKEPVNIKEVEKWHEETNETGETIITNGFVDLKIGDYVDYDEQTGATQTSYTSLSTNSGALQDQVFNLTSYQHGWRVLGVDEETNEILLVAEDFIGPDSGGKEENGRTYYYLRSQEGYINGQTELETISKLYGQGKRASGARSISIEDINKLTKYDPETEHYGSGQIDAYQNKVIYTKNASTGYIEYSGISGGRDTSRYTSYTYFDENTNEWKVLGSGESITITSTYYHYVGATYLNSNSVMYEMLFENSVNSEIQQSNKTSVTGCKYWLASSCIRTDLGYAYYGIRHVYKEEINYSNAYSSSGASISGACGVRPVISLEADINIAGGTGTAEDPYKIH